MAEWMDSWVDGWVGGSKNSFKDCLGQSKIFSRKNQLSYSFFVNFFDKFFSRFVALACNVQFRQKCTTKLVSNSLVSKSTIFTKKI